MRVELRETLKMRYPYEKVDKMDNIYTEHEELEMKVDHTMKAATEKVNAYIS